MSSVPRTPDEPRDQPSDDQVTGDQVTGDEPQGEGTQIVDPQVDEAPATPEEPAARPPSIPVGSAAPRPRSETHPDTDEIEVVLPLSVVRVVPGVPSGSDGSARPTGSRPAPGERPDTGRPARAPRPAPSSRPGPPARPSATGGVQPGVSAATDGTGSKTTGPQGTGTDGSATTAAATGTTSSTPPRTPEEARRAARAAMSPGQRFRSAFRPRMTRAQGLAAVLCAVLGFALVVQLQQNQQDEFSGLRQSDLVRILDDVSKRSDSLEREATSLRESEFELRSGSDSQQAALELAEKNAEIQGILSGRLPAEGPGLELQIVQGDSPISAARLFNVLEELRNAGAEAIDVNGIRMVTSSHFEDTGTGVSIDGIVVSPPYRWTVIGDPQTLEPAMAIPGGAVASITTSGGRTTIEQKELVQIRSVRDPSEPRFATPATDQ
ncbi:uncharacterized conserved protein [Sanguibacter keddieii DSM 10542]|uniref:Uncharacterized conserved protein n=1 Tax=Sanguibacter keddieii (strain ATCC 51767 / DSM 10542 / NCFB 3025 / ST-74) TaxID=446469 RepID=D1BH31_SANKS|nr:DUF881 domain-containing protein [Sanguibacter keddieii]ACZ21751.1 uncharacterized conserved protein [Sanguibacter keddieii DSM 10542]